MIYTSEYRSPLGSITLACDDEAITGLWFEDSRHYGDTLPDDIKLKLQSTECGEHTTVSEDCLTEAPDHPMKHPLLDEASRWLDIYFSGQKPDFLPPLRYGSTKFRKTVNDIMLTIPYGKTMTYGEIAARIARDWGLEKMSAQAVGGAVGSNPISLMVPCHRVVGTNGSLTGYGGRMWRKVKLLELEKVDMSNLYVPKKGTAL
jgi:methylated-DNA-[protein]-cysteine S-methyltransferase